MEREPTEVKRNGELLGPRKAEAGGPGLCKSLLKGPGAGGACENYLFESLTVFIPILCLSLHFCISPSCAWVWLFAALCGLASLGLRSVCLS